MPSYEEIEPIGAIGSTKKREPSFLEIQDPTEFIVHNVIETDKKAQKDHLNPLVKKVAELSSTKMQYIQEHHAILSKSSFGEKNLKSDELLQIGLDLLLKNPKSLAEKIKAKKTELNKLEKDLNNKKDLLKQGQASLDAKNKELIQAKKEKNKQKIEEISSQISTINSSNTQLNQDIEAIDKQISPITLERESGQSLLRKNSEFAKNAQAALETLISSQKDEAEENRITKEDATYLATFSKQKALDVFKGENIDIAKSFYADTSQIKAFLEGRKITISEIDAETKIQYDKFQQDMSKMAIMYKIASIGIEARGRHIAKLAEKIGAGR